MLAVVLWLTGSIELLNPQATVFAEGERVLSLRITAESHLPVAVDELEIGVLYAPTAADLNATPPERVYRDGGQGPMRVVQRRLSVTLPARGSVNVQLTAALGRDAPLPQAFRPHLLGYRLVHADASLLLRLAAAGSVADEMAAVRTLGLLDDAQGRRTVRARFRAGEIRKAFVAEALALIPLRPTTQAVQRRVYAVLALGVLGGSEATRALKALRGDRQLWRFDEALQVMRAARLIGSSWEAPLAYAFPTSCRVMADVVDVALADAASE